MGRTLLALEHAVEAAAASLNNCQISEVKPLLMSQANPVDVQTGLVLVLRKDSHFIVVTFALFLRFEGRTSHVIVNNFLLKF